MSSFRREAVVGNMQLWVDPRPTELSKAGIARVCNLDLARSYWGTTKGDALLPVPRFITYGAPHSLTLTLNGLRR
jgi:hypothetical protein